MSIYYNKKYDDYSESSEIIELEDKNPLQGRGGCFPAGTYVRTYKGWTPIEKLNPYDQVISYDKRGKLSHGTIEQIYIHEKEEVKEEYLYNFQLEINNELIWTGEITGNHALYDHSTNEHKQAKEFTVGEQLSDLHNNFGTIQQIIKNPIAAREDTFKVYNLEVVPQHTFLVGFPKFWLKVHNGGGGKGGGRTPVEEPNTLQTKLKANVLEVLSEGPIEGIVNGLKGIFLDGVAVQNADNTFNYYGVNYAERVGLPSQEIIPGFEETSSAYQLGTTVTQQTPVTRDSIGGTVSVPINAIIVTIGLPEGLVLYEKETGDVKKFEVEYIIESSPIPTSGTPVWTEVVRNKINDKTTSAYELDHRIEAPAGANFNWAVRVSRISPNDSSLGEHSTIKLQRWTEIVTQNPPETYNNSAIVGISSYAEQTAGRIPVRGYLIKGRIVDIPSNFDPITRTYTGIWDGSFIQEWTDDPAWIVYDMLTHERYGINSFMGQIINVDSGAFYEASLYNNCASWNGSSWDYNLIDDGYGGSEVRFTCNIYIQTQIDAWKLIQALASSMNAIVVQAGNIVTLIQDRPDISTKIFNNANVIEGLFSYSSANSSEQTTSANITFNDKLDRYLPRTINIEAEQAILDKFGYNRKEFIAVGKVTESEAIRFGRNILYTENYLNDIVTFGVALNVVDIEVGKLVTVLDNDFVSDTAIFLAGRIKNVSGTTVTLDNSINLLEDNFVFGCANADYSAIIERNITTLAGVVNTIELDSALPAGDYINNEFYCYKTGVVEPRLFRIIKIEEVDTGKYNVIGLLYKPEKYTYIETGLIVENHKYFTLAPVPDVTGLKVVRSVYNDGINTLPLFRVQWDYNSKHISFFVEIIRYNNETYDLSTKDRFLEFKNPLPGNYEIRVTATDISKRKSNPVTMYYDYAPEATSTLLPPATFIVQGGGTVFNSISPTFEWTYDANNDDNQIDRLKDYVVEVWSADGLAEYNTYIIPYDNNSASALYKGGQQLYARDIIYKDFGNYPRNFLLKLFSRDTNGKVSASFDQVFTNPAPASPTGTITGFGRQVTFTLDSLYSVPDFGEMIIAVSLSSGFSPTRDTWYHKATAEAAKNGVVLTAPDQNTYYVRVAISDTYEEDQLNWSSEYSITLTDSSAIIFEVPDTPTNLQVVVDTTFNVSGELINRATATWDAPTQPVTGYTLAYRNFTAGETNYHYWDVSEPRLSVEGFKSGDSYRIMVRSNNGDAHSAYTAEENVSITGDTTPPGEPSGLTVSNGFNTVTLSWINPTDYDQDSTDIYYSATNDRATSTKIATAGGKSTSYVFPDLAPGLTGYFWIRSSDTSGNLSNFHPNTTPGVVGTTQHISETDLNATVNVSLTNGDTAYSGTAGYRTPGAPTNIPSPLGITITENSNGTRDVTLTWSTYTQGAKQADVILIFYKEGTSTIAPEDPAIAMNVNAGGIGTYIFQGIPPDKTYRAGIAAARRTENGWEITAIAQPISPSTPDWSISAGTPNYTANFDGTAAATVTANIVTAGTTAEWANVSGTTGAITDTHLANEAVTNLKIAAAAVTASKTSLAAINSSTGNLNANTVTSTNIVAGTIVGSDIAAGTITVDKLTVSTLSAITADMGSITAGSINTNGKIYSTGFAGPGNPGIQCTTATASSLGIYSSVGSGGTGVQGSCSGAGKGVYGTNSSSTGTGVVGVNTSTGYGVYSDGKFGTNNSTLVTNLNADMVDSKHADKFCQLLVLDTGTCNVAGNGIQFHMGGSLASAYRTYTTGNNSMLITDVASDERVKSEIHNESWGLNFINMLLPKTFRMNHAPELIHHGFVAQDIEKIVGEPNVHSILTRTDDGYLALGNMALIGPLVNAVKELSNQIEILKKEIEELKNG